MYVLDLLSGGHSSESTGASPTFGFYELIDYVYYNLPYIDSSRIGIAGYSKGGGNVVRVMTQYGEQQREHPDTYEKKVAAALILAPPIPRWMLWLRTSTWALALACMIPIPAWASSLWRDIGRAI